jgi:hypothetical protein
MKGAAEWAKKAGSPEIVLTTISPVDLNAAYGIAWRTVTESELKEPGPHVYAVGMHTRDGIDWLSRYKPSKIIGHSMWIYDFRKK